jgi:hypothetical protein
MFSLFDSLNSEKTGFYSDHPIEMATTRSVGALMLGVFSVKRGSMLVS